MATWLVPATTVLISSHVVQVAAGGTVAHQDAVGVEDDEVRLHPSVHVDDLARIVDVDLAAGVTHDAHEVLHGESQTGHAVGLGDGHVDEGSRPREPRPPAARKSSASPSGMSTRSKSRLLRYLSVPPASSTAWVRPASLKAPRGLEVGLSSTTT